MPSGIQALESKYSSLIKQIIRFAIVGIINTAISFGVINLLSFLLHVTKGEKIIWITMVGFIIATTNSYFLNKAWSFSDKGTSDGGRKPTLFLLVSLIGLGINTSVVYLITTHVSPVLGLGPHLWENFALVIATGISLIWNFIGYKLFVFKS